MNNGKPCTSHQSPLAIIIQNTITQNTITQNTITQNTITLIIIIIIIVSSCFILRASFEPFWLENNSKCHPSIYNVHVGVHYVHVHVHTFCTFCTF